ncbi:MAG: hypothetical protein K8E66_12215, partial [Phycisphaerales bacterium]|nr:hypothetical protein [Phycisphaerales bacterium]
MRRLSKARDSVSGVVLLVCAVALPPGCAGRPPESGRPTPALIEADLRARAAFDALPDAIKPVVDQKIKKKARATPTSGGAASVEFFLH